MTTCIRGDSGGTQPSVGCTAGADIGSDSRFFSAAAMVSSGVAAAESLSDPRLEWGRRRFLDLNRARHGAGKGRRVGLLERSAGLRPRRGFVFFLLDIYTRLQGRGLINRPTFNLPLTQEQIADHLGLTVVHVNRTLRRLREERLAMLDRQVVIILDLDRVREMAQGLPQLSVVAELTEGPESVVGVA